MMGIGEFARAAGVSVDAVRFYERRGVLRPAPRTRGGYRRFAPGDLDRVRLARRLQQLGLSLAEVAEALAAHDREGGGCASQRWRLERAETRVAQRLEELEQTRRLIREAMTACDAGDCRLTASPSTQPPA